MYSWENERAEACAAGRRALLSLMAAQRELNKASDWGLWDIFGGGFFVSLSKKSKMEEANRYIEQSKKDLQDFKKKCSGTLSVQVDGLETGDFWSFADVWMDGLLVDLFVQNRITETKKQVAIAIEKVKKALNQLEN